MDISTTDVVIKNSLGSNLTVFIDRQCIEGSDVGITKEFNSFSFAYVFPNKFSFDLNYLIASIFIPDALIIFVR